VLPTVEGLYHYMLDRDADLAGCVILALEADRAPDEDFDADEGAILVLPRAILACEPVDRRLADEIKRRTGELSR
jgi:hypothetical protein